MGNETVVADPQPEQKKPRKKAVRYREFGSRNFLNVSDRESDAFISVRVKNDKWDGYSIRITDCNDMIKLHGGLDKIKSRKNAIHKVDTLINTLTELKEHLISEFNRNNLKY